MATMNQQVESGPTINDIQLLTNPSSGRMQSSYNFSSWPFEAMDSKSGPTINQLFDDANIKKLYYLVAAVDPLLKL